MYIYSPIKQGTGTLTKTQTYQYNCSLGPVCCVLMASRFATIYHAVCRTKYQTEANATPLGIKEMGEQEEKEKLGTKDEPQPSYWQQERDVHMKAFDALACYV